MTKKVITPTIMQMSPTECGAVAFGIILAYYGKFVPLDELRHECGVSRNGTQLTNVWRAAKKYGLEASCYRKELTELKNIQLPFVIFCNFNHFIVVEGFKKNKIYLNDPGVGRRVIDGDELDQMFTGIALTFRPTAEFKPSGTHPSWFAGIKKWLVGYRLNLFNIFLISLISIIPLLIIPMLTKDFIDQVLLANHRDWVKPVLLGLIITALARGVLGWLRNYYLTKLRAKISAAATDKYFRQILRLPMMFFDHHLINSVSNRVLLNDKVAFAIINIVMKHVFDLAIVISCLGLMFYYSPLIAVISLITAIANVLLWLWLDKVTSGRDRYLAMKRGVLDDIVFDMMEAIETLKLAGIQSDCATRITRNQISITNQAQQLHASLSLPLVMPLLLGLVNMAIILTVGSSEIMHGAISIGMLIALQSLAASFMQPITDLMKNFNAIRSLHHAINLLDDTRPSADEITIMRPVETRHGVPLRLATKFSGNIELRNISFGYHQFASPLVNNLNLSIQAGKRIAIVGLSGSGKSTLVKLIAQLYQPWTGEIYFDGVKFNESQRATLINSLAVVDQEIKLFHGTVRENIALWQANISLEQIIQAAKIAEIHDEIMRKELAYDTVIMHNGGNFSSGQRQRIEIARALVNNPTILICDEATSCLDALTELKIHRNLKRAGYTEIIIAHRLSTIRDCDEIMVLANGSLVQRGTHEELINDQANVYYQLVND